MSRENRLVTIGDASNWYAMGKERRRKLPVGDYWPMTLSVGLGRLDVELSPNHYDGDGEFSGNKRDYCVSIREDQPFVFDFSNRPEVTFISPKATAAFKPGQEVEFEAFLVDRKLDLLITDIKDRKRKHREITIMNDDGKPVTVPLYESLDPTVVIRDSSGNQIASGKMPFG